MKYYIRFLLCAALCGIMFFATRSGENNMVYASDIIISLGFGTVECFPPYFINFVYYFTPILIFQILYGTYIYRHFCSAFIYYFSRTENKIKWYIKQAFELFFLSLLYVILLLSSSIASASIFNDVVFCKTNIVLVFYFLVIYVLFVFATTNLINILSIAFSGSVAFIIVDTIQILSMALFVLTDMISENEITKKNLFILLNPVAHLVLRVHTGINEEMSSLYSTYGVIGKGFDFNISVFVYFIFMLISLILGCVVVKKKDVIVNSEQEEF